MLFTAHAATKIETGDFSEALVALARVNVITSQKNTSFNWNFL